ncbi:DUF6788 family protein [Tunicatimonas pelagia]|uniref:DUF6788 family protein n=1 Tax=Tunicatimonas pelagia TaxID=931531 RepID=UPI0026651DCC|nr:DUF6788 family protein [Tunicatimonas pelagia]WKN46520.1 hypothetical protein P0M28_30895 [Tunicatimonas pelagia]
METINRDWLFKLEVQAGRQTDKTLRDAIAQLERILDQRASRPDIKPRKSREVIRREQVGYMTLQLEKVSCGKPKCKRCKEGPSHGPYWYGYWKEGKRTRSRYIGKNIEGADILQPTPTQ